MCSEMLLLLGNKLGENVPEDGEIEDKEREGEERDENEASQEREAEFEEDEDLEDEGEEKEDDPSSLIVFEEEVPNLHHRSNAMSNHVDSLSHKNGIVKMALLLASKHPYVKFEFFYHCI
jgi:hypothetical protein